MEESADGDALLLPGVPGEGAANPLQLSDGAGMPGTKTFDSQWSENDALAVAWRPGLVQLPFVSNCQSMARFVCGSGNKTCLEGINHRYIKGCVFSTGMFWDENVWK